MPSINTNYGAAVALQSLNKTNAQLETTQNRISTGMKVSSAKDNGAIFAIATQQRANAASQDATRNSLQRSQSITDVALAAGDTITSALEEMKSLAVSIQSSVGCPLGRGCAGPKRVPWVRVLMRWRRPGSVAPRPVPPAPPRAGGG